LLTHASIVLDLVMRLVERPREPRIVSTINVVTFISHVKVSDDLRPSRIFGHDLRSSVQWPFRLEEIDCRFDIRRYDDGLLTGFGHDINLNGKQHGDFKTLQFFGECHSFRCPPAMAIKDNLRLLFFRGC